MSANYTPFSFQLFDTRTKRPIDDDSGLFKVLTVSTPDTETCYSDANGTSLTQPATMTNGLGQFWTSAATTSVDLIVLTATGHSTYIRGFTPSQHRIDIDPERVNYKLVLPFTTSLSGVNYNTGFVLTQNILIKDVKLRVTTADGTAALTVGNTTVGIAGYVLGGILTATGYRLLDESLSGAECLGSALAYTATNFAFRKSVRPANATSALGILYANSTASGGTASPAKGFIIMEYDRLRTP